MALPPFPASRKRNSRYKVSDRTPNPASIIIAIISCVFLGGLGWIWTTMLTKGYVAIGGVPSPIIISFLRNETARAAYFDGDNEKLHAQMQSMDLAEKLKPYYRPQFANEAQLDRYTHQILYDRTGYIGKAYQVNPQGILVVKKGIVQNKK
ncbi:MAG: hypothetical protein KME01_01780 [Chroococcus sp. CMT-3BRIN-NPC107]|jgi:hypothetical protein|nr:hypothetical protein [Chroococcus sp. CMT-3BRIN-NPC107]